MLQANNRSCRGKGCEEWDDEGKDMGIFSDGRVEMLL
jgi:hypothetical protein